MAPRRAGRPPLARSPAASMLILGALALLLAFVPPQMGGGSGSGAGGSAGTAPIAMDFGNSTAATPAAAPHESPSHGTSPPAWDPARGRSSPGSPSYSLKTISLAHGNCAASWGEQSWLAFDSADRSFWIAAPPSCVERVPVSGSGPGSVSASFTVGSEPFAVAVDNATDQVYVTNSGSNDVSVLSGKNGARLAHVLVGETPYGATFDPGVGDAFVANGGSNSVSVISGTSHLVVATVSVQSTPVGILADPATGQVFVADRGSNCLSVINATNDSVTRTIGVGDRPYGLALDPKTDRVYVTNEGSANISVIDASNDTVVASIPVSADQVDIQGISVDSADGLIWVGAGYFYAVVASVTTNRVVGYLSSDPSGSAYDPVGRWTCMTNTGNFTLACFRLKWGTITAAGVTLRETGLPVGSGWTVSLNESGSNSTVQTSYTNSMNFEAFPGFWPPGYETVWYTVAPADGETPSAASGSLTLGYGSGVNLINITFTAPANSYPVWFNQTGLPSGA
ncbi:MAG: YncE family protein, partial [Thermoplasmata archaeon]|nr:YncE family protein [Thermoplasmata archaeon]